LASGDLTAACQANLETATIKASGAGKAYQSVAQSMAIAVADATDYLRHISSISATAIGLATAKFAETKDPQWLAVIKAAENALSVAQNDFKTIGTHAADILKGFPPS